MGFTWVISPHEVVLWAPTKKKLVTAFLYSLDGSFNVKFFCCCFSSDLHLIPPPPVSELWDEDHSDVFWTLVTSFSNSSSSFGQWWVLQYPQKMTRPFQVPAVRMWPIRNVPCLWVTRSQVPPGREVTGQATVFAQAGIMQERLSW